MSDLGNIASSGIGTVAAIGMSAAQNYENRVAAAKTQEYTRSNMDKAFRQQLTLDRLATPLAVQGMRDAGLSPVGMSSPMKPSSSPSSPQGANVQPADFSSIAQAAANIRLTNAEANIKEKEAARIVEEDDAARVNIVDQMRQRLLQLKDLGVDESNPYYQDISARIEAIESNKNFNLGSVRGAVAAISADDASIRKFTDNLEQIYRQLNQDRLLKKSPYLDSSLKIKKLALESAQIALLSARTEESETAADKNEQQILNLQKEIKKIDAEIAESEARTKKLGTEEKVLYQSSVNALWSDEEYMSALRAAGVNSFDELVKAAILAKGLKGAKGFTAAGGEVSAPTFKPLPSEKSPLGKLSGFSKSKGNPFPSSSANADAFNSMVKYHGYDNAISRYADWLKIPKDKRPLFSDFVYGKRSRFPL